MALFGKYAMLRVDYKDNCAYVTVIEENGDTWQYDKTFENVEGKDKRVFCEEVHDKVKLEMQKKGIWKAAKFAIKVFGILFGTLLLMYMFMVRN